MQVVKIKFVRYLLRGILLLRHIAGMNGKHSYGFETPAYSYAEAETAVAAAAGVRAQHQRGALRARLKHLQRLGLVELKAKKGKRAEYSRSQVTQWLLALILAEIGLDPTVVVATIKGSWKDISRDVEQATSHEARSGRFISYLILMPRAMSAAWEQKFPVAIHVIQIDAPQYLVPIPHSQPLVEMINRNLDDWSCFYNLTRALSRLETALPRRG